MSEQLAKQMSPDEIRETAMVDLAFHMLKEKGEPILYRNLMQEVAQLKGFTEEQINHYISQLYTEMNIDGRFICVGKSLWGLRGWYPTEQATDSAVAQNVKDDYSDELDEEDLFDGEEDGFESEADTDDADFEADFEEDGEYDEDGDGDDEDDAEEEEES
ncbi:DNA-directed RNA polymerase subunit delta [Desmospora profundinema]|uniref:Probable DNA-directed RNA polymerase subunit delta n=1 Tax=Desmospora profundinema TaxID=1571184 RepID=A0ABU1IND1_9BACL|nr:DNA-directed RNA polymerase subunit delta [Desmospora profundinema]MDR6225479.1 DNA-directed RNA polymerase subunit delta [Desmospora profundinema]